MKKKVELDGKTWTRLSISVWNDIKKDSEEIKLGHPAMFPVQLVSRLLKMYSFKGGTVLDPFLGSGSTLVGCKREGRKGTGFDINDAYINLAKKRLKQNTLLEQSAQQIVIKDDANTILKHVKENSVDFCITSPPYWDILRQKRTADYKEERPYSDSEDDLGNILDYNKFILSLKKIFSNVFKVMKKGKRCVIVLMDIRKGPKFYPFHIDVTKMMNDIGFDLDDIIIWDRRSEYNNIRPLGYPYVFRVNKIHEFLLIFQKPDGVEEIKEEQEQVI